jgi:hypothetical protein
MERNFTNENMEEFLRQSADGLRMRPSAKVWKGISSHLSRRRRITGLILGTSFLVISALGYYMLNESAKNFNTNSNANNTQKTQSVRTAQPVVDQFSNKKLVAVNSDAIKRSNKTYEAIPAETKEFTFTQTLLQRNAETAQYAFSPTVVDSYFDTEINSTDKLKTFENSVIADPLSIESVSNSYKPKAKKLGWQTYFTPTVSYRKLSDNYIDNVAPHKPAFGFELGLAAKYLVSKNTKFRAGLQFNVNRYEIKTYDSYAQLATIRLNDRNGTDYVRTVTNYNNFTGYQSNWLQNFYFQVSAPVGVEFKVKGDDKVQFGLASTVQPTYLLGDKAYVISSDYKNYANMPDLVRRWNVNTSLETFVAYSTGHLNWQVGPQVRYQILSSYVKKYPVKENLFDFGLKVGISVNR